MIKNIVIINDYANINGGASQVAINSAYLFAKSGYKVTFIYGCGYPDKLLEHENIEKINLGLYDLLTEPNKYKAMINGLFNYRVKSRVFNILSKFSCCDSIIHIHSWTKTLSSSVFSAAKKSKIDVFLTLHDYFSICPNGALFDFKKKKICKFTPLSISCFKCDCDSRSYIYKVWRYIRQIILKYQFNGDYITYIPVSKFSFSILNRYLVNCDVNNIVYNPIRSVPSSKVAVSTSKNMLYVGRLEVEKGVDFLISNFDDDFFVLNIVGSGSIKNIFDTKKNIKYLGWLNQNEVINEFRKARFLVFPSVIYETLGLTVLEAFSLGVPVLISNVCAGTEFVKDGYNGLIYNVNDSKDFLLKLELLKNDKFIEELSVNAFNTYWNNPFTESKYIKNIISIYHRKLNEGISSHSSL
ncbi:Glycogen synthase [Photobacterium malacitanum]|uniref:Glycogen synthase n=1 Tax=Photobacterium malacitanum TaxID=2204294 RepID=A0A1Y6MG68_9GAMM|nr:glycosyltransferase family 4 protein [Photobacterium malacitanum]SMY35617.1 Glycogen synthase [Photobacterium malacitanum]